VVAMCFVIYITAATAKQTDVMDGHRVLSLSIPKSTEYFNSTLCDGQLDKFHDNLLQKNLISYLYNSLVFIYMTAMSICYILFIIFQQ